MNSQKTIYSRVAQLTAVFASLLFLASCGPTEKKAELDISSIEGEYEGKGECVITSNGERSVITVDWEKDKIEKYPKSKGIYQVKIEGPDGFKELEIGPLSGNIIYAATAEVSDSTYPVLEQYIFDTDKDGKVTGYTKIVRNPGNEGFKSCVITAEKK